MCYFCKHESLEKIPNKSIYWVICIQFYQHFAQPTQKSVLNCFCWNVGVQCSLKIDITIEAKYNIMFGYCRIFILWLMQTQKKSYFSCCFSIDANPKEKKQIALRRTRQYFRLPMIVLTAFFRQICDFASNHDLIRFSVCLWVWVTFASIGRILAKFKIVKMTFENIDMCHRFRHCENCTPWPWPNFLRYKIWNINISETVRARAKMHRTTFVDLIFAIELPNCENFTPWLWPTFWR